MTSECPVLRFTTNGRAVFWCPGCKDFHSIPIQGRSEETGPKWKLSGGTEQPTISPSLLLRTGHFASGYQEGENCWCIYNAEQKSKGEPESSFKCVICHSVISNGIISFLADSSHDMASNSMPLSPLAEFEGVS